MSKIPWNEKVVAISIHPDSAKLSDIANMAADLMETKSQLAAANDEIAQLQERIKKILDINLTDVAPNSDLILLNHIKSILKG